MGQEVGGENGVVMVHVSGGDVMANANTTRTNKGLLNKEPLRVAMYKVLLHERRLHPHHDRFRSKHSNLLM